jgi:hypothetical protein
VVQTDSATEPYQHLGLPRADEVHLAGVAVTCRGTWARVTMDQFRRLALQPC